MTREQAISYLISSGFSEEQVNTIAKAFEPTTKNDLGVDCISRQAVLDLIDADWKYENLEIEINNLPSVTPQESILDKMDEIITDALDKSTDQKESQTLRWILDKISENG